MFCILSGGISDQRKASTESAIGICRSVDRASRSVIGPGFVSALTAADMAQACQATRAGIDTVAPFAPEGRLPAVKWAVRPTPSAPGGAARPLPLGL